METDASQPINQPTKQTAIEESYQNSPAWPDTPGAPSALNPS